MLFLIAFIGAAIITLVLWRAMNTVRGDAPLPSHGQVRPARRPRVSGPDDDPDFLRKLDEKVRRQEDPPAS
ncbi:MAG: hypothetical protein ACRDRH_09320 [Pseudonocardia sp.]